MHPVSTAEGLPLADVTQPSDASIRRSISEGFNLPIDPSNTHPQISGQSSRSVSWSLPPTASTRSGATSRTLSLTDSIWKQPVVSQQNTDEENATANAYHSTDTSNTAVPYHIYDRSRKKKLILLVSLAAVFSPLSSNIYFPALVTIAKALNTPITLISLSITTYLVVQGLAPSFWGPLSDIYGRRPIFLSTFVVYILANLGLGLTQSFPVLMVFRALQAGGSSATIALGSGVISDITVRAERGGLMGIFGGLRMFGQAFGPVIGGILSQYLGFRSIFWFLLITGFIVMTLLYFFLPETHRGYAGNGSIPQKGMYQTGWDLCKSRLSKGPPIGNNDASSSTVQKRPHNLAVLRTFQDQLVLLFEPDVLVTLLFGSVIYTVWSMVTATTSSLFETEYQLDDVLIGLVFIPNGVGCVAGSYITGLIMDFEYKRTTRKYLSTLSNLSQNPSSPPTHLDLDSHTNFPLEKARLRPMWPIVAVFIIAVGAYGWTLEYSMAIPLVLQFIIAFTATAVFNINSTMIIDLYPTKPASATAINNFMRCEMGAIGVGVVNELQQKYKERALFTGLAAFTLICCPLLVIEWVWGPGWRITRAERTERD